jgi:hypothetical protein
VSEIPERQIDIEEDGTPIMWRVMSATEILEREQLNRENTGPAIRVRVLAELAKANGS